MRSPLTALEAFTRDARVATTVIGDAYPRLAGWFAVTKAAEQLCVMRDEERGAYVASLASGVLPPSPARPTLIHDAMQAPSNPLGRVTERLRVEAEDMERAGCFEMAFTTVAAACRLAVDADLVSRLTATAHLGRIARQLGDLGTAADCYDVVVGEAARVRDGPLGALGILGQGSVAHMRGNRPEERRLYDVALSLAHPGGVCECSAHIGLMNVANAENRVPDAFAHGWRAFDVSPEGSDARATTLSNLAFAALRSGFAGAALNGFLHVLSLTAVSRIRLTVISGAMRSAALRDDRQAVRELEETGRQEALHANLPFEIASFTFHAAEAWQTLAEFDAASRLLVETRRIADKYGFYELGLKAEAALNSFETLRDTTLRAPTSAPGSAHTRKGDVARVLMNDGIRRLEALSV